MCRAGTVHLSALATRSEILIEQMQGKIPSMEWGRAMNCVCLLEEINAITLDENRPLTLEEEGIIKSELELLGSIVIRNCEKDEF